MKKILSIALVAFIGLTGFAQTPPDAPKLVNGNWSYLAVGNATFTQLSLRNWAAGGQNSLSLVGFIDARADYKNGKSTWENYLRTGYGVLRQGSSDPFKSDDLIELNSKYGYPAGKDWFYSAQGNFRSQFDQGFNDPLIRDTVVSGFMAPGFLLLSLGMDYKPSDNLSVLISPVTMKQTYVLRSGIDETRYGLEAGDRVRTELGAGINVIYKTVLMENISYSTNLALFSSYLENPENIDVNWSNIFAFTVNKYINVNFQLDLLYDYDIDVDQTTAVIDRKAQWKQVLGVGLRYNFLQALAKKDEVILEN